MTREMIPTFTKEDFETGTEPYEFVYKFENNLFEQEQVLHILSGFAKIHGIRNFIKRAKEYARMQKAAQRSVLRENTTAFEGQPIELICGDWKADEFGIFHDTAYGTVCACRHPIMPIQRLINIDTGTEKVKIAYRKGRAWRFVIVERRTIASASSIVSLSEYGIGVTSENAKYLVSFLHDVEHLNFDEIDEKNSVGRLGWVSEGFSPYVDDLIFDGDLSCKSFFESVQESGNYSKWLTLVKSVYHNKIVRITLGASFGSVLIDRIGSLPFFNHLWGGSEAGKTVLLMLAASIWANPEMGKYIHTFNSTSVGREKSAGFVNSLPLIFDELQIQSDKKSFDSEIYMLSEGIGRTRGAKQGGLQRLETWRNVIITSGEMPILGASSGGGAVNRIIEVECQEKLFKAPREVANTIRKNYGFAGKLFVEYLTSKNKLDEAEKLFKEYQTEIEKTKTTEKQTMAAAIILTADKLASECIYDDNSCLTVADILPYLKSKSEVSVNDRAYDYLNDFIVQNKNKFSSTLDSDTWGKIEGERIVYIIRSQFDKIMKDEGFNSQSFLSWAKRKGLIECAGGKNTKISRINGIPTRCVVLSLAGEKAESDEVLSELFPDKVQQNGNHY